MLAGREGGVGDVGGGGGGVAFVRQVREDPAWGKYAHGQTLC